MGHFKDDLAFPIYDSEGLPVSKIDHGKILMQDTPGPMSLIKLLIQIENSNYVISRSDYSENSRSVLFIYYFFKYIDGSNYKLYLCQRKLS